MATDEYHETEEETIARHKMMVEGLSDPRQMNWAVWEGFIYESKCLTPKGKEVALWAVGILRQTLGDDFFQRIVLWMEKMRKKNPDTQIDPHPAFCLGYFPVNDAPWVYSNVFRLAASIQLFQQMKTQVGIEGIVRNLRRDVSAVSWNSTLIQLEVAALGLKAGWDILFEPPYERGGKSDVRLSKGTHQILIDARVMRFSDVDRKIMSFTEQLMGQIGAIGLQHNVTICGLSHCASLMNADDFVKFLHTLEEAAQATSLDGKSRQILEPGETHLTIYHPSETAPDDNLEIQMGMLGEYTFSRLKDILEKKNKQASRSDMPVWVRIDEYAGMLEVMRSHGMNLSQMRDYLSGLVMRAIALTPLPHVAGVILSSGLALQNTDPSDTDTWIEASSYGGSRVISCYKLVQRIRHTFVIPPHIPSDDVEVFTDLYAHEDEWLDWALEKLNFPSFNDLVQ